MLCDDCNIKDATVHMTTVLNGKKEEISLCNECAKKREKQSFENNFSMHSFLASLLEGNVASNTNINYQQKQKCIQCGSTYNDFKQNGRLGCNMCYETFNDMLSPLIRRIQGNSTHAGKVPKKAGAPIRLRKKLKHLKNQLQQLIIREEFEEAAQIRDEIKKLEGEISNM